MQTLGKLSMHREHCEASLDLSLIPTNVFRFGLWPIKGILYAITRFQMTSQVYNSVAMQSLWRKRVSSAKKRFEAIDHGHLISQCRFPKVYSLFSPLSLQKLIKQNSIPPFYSSSCSFVSPGFRHLGLPLITASPCIAISWIDVDFVSYPCLSGGWLIHLSIFQWWLCWHPFSPLFPPFLRGCTNSYPSMYHLPGYIFASLHSVWRKNK